MRSVTLKSAMTPSFMGLMATMLPGVRPSISLASLPTASTSPVFLLSATMEGSLRSEIGDDAVLHGLDGDDVAGSAAQHLLGFLAHGFHFAGVFIERDDGGLVDYNAL